MANIIRGRGRKSARPSPTRNAPFLQLVPDPVSIDVVLALEDLLIEARKGKVRGLAFVAIEDRWAYTVDALGLAAHNPAFTSGALMKLLSALSADI